MERILVGVGPRHPNLWAAGHAMGLAKRMKATVSVLLVMDPGSQEPATGQAPYRQKLEALMEQARSEGLAVDYYVSQGRYEDEVVRFIKENKVTMLVIEQPAGRKGSSMESNKLIEKIRHRVDCRIEVVQGTGRSSTALKPT